MNTVCAPTRSQAKPNVDPYANPPADFREGDGRHTVVPDETMTSIAAKHGLPVQELIDANPQIKNPDRIGVNDQLRIPKNIKAAPAPQSKCAKDGHDLTADHDERASRNVVRGPEQEATSVPPAEDESLKADLMSRLHAARNAPARLYNNAKSLRDTAISEVHEGLTRTANRLAGNDPNVVGQRQAQAIQEQADAIRHNHDTAASEAAYRDDPTNANWHQWQADLARDRLVVSADQALVDGDISAAENLDLHRHAGSIAEHQKLAD